MSYPKRHTNGFVDCRPKGYKGRDIFPKPTLLCNAKCPFYEICIMEEQQLTLGDRIKRLRLEFKKPYFCWTVLSNEQVLLTFEDERGQRLSFRGESMVKAVFNAESWSKIEEEKRERMERMKKEEENPKK